MFVIELLRLPGGAAEKATITSNNVILKTAATEVEYGTILWADYGTVISDLKSHGPSGPCSPAFNVKIRALG